MIALPFYKKTFNEGSSCFIDIETFKPIEKQWEFLQNIKRISKEKLTELFQENLAEKNVFIQNNVSENLVIQLNNQVKINRNGLTTILIDFLKEELNFANAEFIIKKKISKNTFGTDRFFKLLDENTNEIIIPRGFISKLIRFFRENKIVHVFKDERKKLPKVLLNFSAQLREHQQTAIVVITKKDFGVIVTPL